MRATLHQLTYGITCHPTRASQAGTRFIYPRGMEGWVDLGVWLYTEIVYLSADIQIVTRPCAWQLRRLQYLNLMHKDKMIVFVHHQTRSQFYYAFCLVLFTLTSNHYFSPKFW